MVAFEQSHIHYYNVVCTSFRRPATGRMLWLHLMANVAQDILDLSTREGKMLKVTAKDVRVNVNRFLSLILWFALSKLVFIYFHCY